MAGHAAPPPRPQQAINKNSKRIALGVVARGGVCRAPRPLGRDAREGRPTSPSPARNAPKRNRRRPALRSGVRARAGAALAWSAGGAQTHLPPPPGHHRQRPRSSHRRRGGGPPPAIQTSVQPPPPPGQRPVFNLRRSPCGCRAVQAAAAWSCQPDAAAASVSQPGAAAACGCQPDLAAATATTTTPISPTSPPPNPIFPPPPVGDRPGDAPVRARRPPTSCARPRGGRRAHAGAVPTH